LSLPKKPAQFFIFNYPARFALIAGVLLVAPLLAFAQQAATPSAASTTSADPLSFLPSPSSPSKTSAATASGGGINIPAPPPPSAISPEATQLAKQAEEAAALAQTLSASQAASAMTPDQAEEEAKAEAAAREQQHNEKSFDRAEKGLLPLAPDQIRDFMSWIETTQKASVPPSGGPPKAKVKFVTLSLDPGVEPPQIDLVAGYVTTITLVDATGQPWPILDVGVGGNFEVTPTKSQSDSHVVRVMPLTRAGSGNLSILLKDLPTPVIFRLAAGGPSVDMRYDARIPKLGPNAKVPLINRPHLEAGSENIMLLLDDAPPSGAKRMKVNGVDERTMAWMLDSHVYVRTPLTLLSPAWDASVSSADGMTVYQIGDAPILLMSDNGAVVRARLMREDDHD
jgi:intracellular multiplication protein IcmK